MNPNYPPYPSQPMPGGQYPPYPTTTSQTPGSMPAPYPNQAGFNSNYAPNYSYAGGYPPQPGSYPPAAGFPPSGGYPAQQPSYPSSYPAQPGFPPSTGPAYPSAYPPSSGPAYPGAYPPQNNPSFPGSAHGYAPSSIPQTGGMTGVSQIQEHLNPSVRPANPFDARKDAEILRKAMKGFGTDEKAIIDVLTKRSNRQRQEIAIQFKAMYGKDLISDLKSELSGYFEDLVVALMTPLYHYLAKELRYAIEGMGTNEQILIEILCTASNAEIFAIRNAYTEVCGRSLENDLSDDTSGHFKRLLVSVVQGRRSESNAVDRASALSDAQALLAAGVNMWGTDESTFNSILCTRSYPQLRCVLAEYQRLSGHSLEQAIRSEFSGDIEDGLLAIVDCAGDKAGYFASRMRDALACIGTKDRQLIRVVVSRCEIDMEDIKRAYQQRYKKSAEQDISEDTSGDYKRALLSLVCGY